MPRGSSPQKINEWTSRLERFAESKQTVGEFCRREGVSEASLYLWKKRLPPVHDVVAARNKHQGVKDKAAPSSFQAVHVTDPPVMTATEATVIQLGNGVQIQLGSDLPVVELVVKQLLAATIAARFAEARPGAESC